MLTGFVLPKFTEATGAAYLDAVVRRGEQLGRRAAGHAGAGVAASSAYAETRADSPAGVRGGCSTSTATSCWRCGSAPPTCPRRTACAARATSRSGTSGWSPTCIADVVNVFGRADGGELRRHRPGVGVLLRHRADVQAAAARVAVHRARRAGAAGRADRRRPRRADPRGRARQANGLTGKTVIHPTHVAAVHALSVVDARGVHRRRSTCWAPARRGGAAASSYGNKMNETKPHTAWARRTMLRAQAVRGGPRGRRPSSTCSARACTRDRLRRGDARTAGGSPTDARASRLRRPTPAAGRRWPSWSGWRCGATPGGRTCWSRPCWASTCPADPRRRARRRAGARARRCAALARRRADAGRARLRRDRHRAGALRGRGARRAATCTRPAAPVADGPRRRRLRGGAQPRHQPPAAARRPGRAAGRGRPLVLVDDELSTGRTALNTIAALHAVAPRARYVVAALVDLRGRRPTGRPSRRPRPSSASRSTSSRWPRARSRCRPTSPAARRPRRRGPPLASPAPAAPAGRVRRRRGVEPRLAGRGPRGRPARRSTRPTPRAARAAADAAWPAACRPIRRAGVLVLGTEELMYAPLLIAARAGRRSAGARRAVLVHHPLAGAGGRRPGLPDPQPR